MVMSSYLDANGIPFEGVEAEAASHADSAAERTVAPSVASVYRSNIIGIGLIEK